MGGTEITLEAARERVLAWRARIPRWKLLAYHVAWYVVSWDYCPQCDQVRRWRIQVLRLADDHPPLLMRPVCRTCGFAGLWDGPLYDVARERAEMERR
jgi:hypothetical protein